METGKESVRTGGTSTRRDVEDFNEYHTRELYFVQSLFNRVYLPVIHIPALSLLSHSRTVVHEQKINK